jgi:hypothetical protein
VEVMQTFQIYRLIVYVLAYAVTVWWLVSDAIAHSQSAYDAGDLSAFAWTGFMPFIFPIFMIQAAFYVLPVVIVAEVIFFCLWYWGWVR